MLKLLIFDLDGTLADTSKDITDAVNYALKPFGVKPLSVSEIKAMVGSGITKLIESLIPGERDFSAKEEAVKRFLEYYSIHLLDYTKPYPQVKETLSKLGAYKKAVISNKREVLSKRVLEGIGLLKFFDIVLGSDSVSERKPSPVPIFELLKRFGVSKDEAVIIGDSNYDIEAGKAAGIKTIAVTYGYRDREVLKGADFIIDNFGEILRILPEVDKV
ncbi:MAG: HAD-IA family hydrolase [Thermodesulfovibrionia bacterium]|nr:HAD-IA family hydrolase [Thermodesulfovibrionia bacterium]